MSYTPFTWANGQSGSNSVVRLNNLEEGVRAATQTLEEVAQNYDAANPDSLYSRASATLQAAQQQNVDAQAAYNAVADAQTLLEKRNAFATLGSVGSINGPGTDIPTKMAFEYTWGLLALYGMVQTRDNYTLVFLKPGWYMMHFNLNITALTATMKIKYNGVVVETIKLAEMPLVTGYVDNVNVCVCLSRYFEANATLGLTFTLTGFPDDVDSSVSMNLMLRRL